ncbi:MAG: ion transporter [Salibacteraceae bacterium]|jgi:voltage-gated potassium channel|nr:ion transporter [Salibacteraceae bacterium]MDP4686528.1 ion transporter [Salibacteraceae bacterium]MDP4763225.1 ion transporter [Salibacteraceae bacterium]MDP4843615.1 ion transporter [Salibacteraceae bacterium]MDP4933678.1 ion transporter [Salibacteraceae bacterium]
MTIRERIFSIIDEKNKASTASRSFDFFIVGLIILNVVAIILESFKSLRQDYKQEFFYFEIFSVAVFTLEYLIRLLTSDLRYPNKNAFKAAIAFLTSPLALVDILAVLPTYLPLLIPIDLRFVRILRLLRITRLFKINRYSKSLKLIGDVFREKRSDLGITFFVTFILMVIASTLMYFIEGDEQPDMFPNIVASFWWAVATLTTVGYGDVYPITAWGKFISGIIALLGIGLVALPTGILSSAFIEKINDKKNLEGNVCPTCGQCLDDKKQEHTD